jgi:NTE family protein
VEIGTGRLDAAFRASCSVPLIWAPVRHQGRVLVDGVMVDPVPAASTYAMGADLCVAINVIGPPEKDAQHLLARVSRWTDWAKPLAWAGDATMPNALDVYMNSLQILWHELGSFKAISADVRVHPDLSGFTWTDFHQSAEIIARGVEAAERALPDIEAAIRARAMAPTGVSGAVGAAATV